MKLIKSILLGAATGLVGVAVAHAADLPRRTKGPAVQYVRICDTYGAGFFYVPGSTDTCIKVGGFIRTDYDVVSTHNILGFDNATQVGTAGLQNTGGFSGRFQVQLDVRTATEYGVLRAFGAGDFNYSPGIGTQGGQNPALNAGGTGFAEKAFIQFGGLTAGLATSFYDFYIYGADDYLSVHSSYSPIGLLAYTATFGGGFSATLSLEDPQARSLGFYNNPTGIALGAYATRAGERFPDVVANLRVDQGWGSAQLSGALHQSQLFNTVTLNNKSETGFAILGGLKINLPMLAAGDALFFEAAYADGATGYLGYDGFSMGPAVQSGATLAYPTVDGVVLGGTTIYKTRGFEGLVALRHYWTPTFFTAGIVGYTQLDQAAAVKATLPGAGGVGNFSEWRFGLTNEWVPVAGFSIGVEVEYARVHQTLPGGAAAVAGYSPNYGTWHGKLRLQRNF